jgi:hypothetical protein
MSSSGTWDSIAQYTSSNTKPDPVIVEKFYNLVLEAQFVPPAVRENLSKKLTYEKKWETVIHYHSMIGNAQVTQNASFGDSDRQLLNSLQNRRKRPDMTQLLNLKSRIGTCNKSWMESFIAENGILILIKAMSSRLTKSTSSLGELDAALLYELICCIKTTINSGMTMKIFLQTENALKTVTYSLLFEWKPLALQVLEVLSVISDYSNEAAAAIVQHLRHLSRLRREPAFEFFAQALLDADVDVKAAVLQLINSLLAGLDHLTDRMALRNDLKALKFNKLCELAVEDLDDELECIKNTTVTTISKRPSILMSSGSLGSMSPGGVGTSASSPLAGRPAVGRNSSVGDLNMSDDIRFTRKLRMRAKHPSEAHIKLFDDTSLLEQQDELYAEDGITPITPSQGIMMGTLEIPRSKLKSMMGFGNATQPKSRFFILNGENLTSWLTDQDPSTAIPYSTIPGIEIMDVRPYSTNEELNSICDHTFEVITPKQVYPFGTTSDEMKDHWITSLNIVRDRMLLKKCSYTLHTADLDSQEFLKASAMFKKQITVYEVISHEDYQHTITKSGVDVTSAISLTNFIYSELCTVGLEGKLMEFLQEIVVVPTDGTKFTEIFWSQIIETCRELKLIQQETETNNKTPTTGGHTATVTSGGGGSLSSSRPGTLEKMRSVRVDAELCKHLLTKKEKTVQGKATIDLNKLTMELFTKNAEIERLSTELGTLRRSATLGGGVMSGLLTHHRKFQSDPIYETAAPSTASEDVDDLGVTLQRKTPKRSNSHASASPGDHNSSRSVGGDTAGGRGGAGGGSSGGGGGPGGDKSVSTGSVQQGYATGDASEAPSSRSSIRGSIGGAPPPPSSRPPSVQSVTFAPPSMPAPAHVIAAAAIQESAPPPPPSRPPPKLSQLSAAGSSPKVSHVSATPPSAPLPAVSSESIPNAGTPTSLEPLPPAASKPVGKLQAGGALAALFKAPQAKAEQPTAPPATPAAAKSTSPADGRAVTGSTRPIPIPPPLPGGVSTGGPPPLPGGISQKKASGGAAVPRSMHQPTRKMKGVFWNKVSNTGAAPPCALWSGIDIKKIDEFKIDYSSLEESFSQLDEKPSSLSKPAHNSTKQTAVSLLDGKRTQNILISSGRVRKTPDDMVQILLNLNPSELTLEMTEMMLTLVPTPEEYTNIKNYPNPSLLGKAEQILLSLGTIPRLKERLDCHRIPYHWNKTSDSITGNLHLLSKACHELSSQDSLKQLQTVMSVIVGVGNFLNGGSNRIAVAVKLDAILKFATVKPTNQKGTLLHFVCRQLRLNYPEACEFYQNWNCITAASDVSLVQLQQDFNALKVLPPSPHLCSSLFLKLSSNRLTSPSSRRR